MVIMPNMVKYNNGAREALKNLRCMYINSIRAPCEIAKNLVWLSILLWTAKWKLENTNPKLVEFSRKQKN